MKGREKCKTKKKKSIVPMFLTTVASLIILHIIVLVLLGYHFSDIDRDNTLKQVHYNVFFEQ